MKWYNVNLEGSVGNRKVDVSAFVQAKNQEEAEEKAKKMANKLYSNSQVKSVSEVEEG